MSAMSDFARLPTRQKVMVFAVIGLVLGGLYYQFAFKGLKADLEIANNQNASKKGLNKKLEADIPAFEALKARMNVLKKIIDENQKALPTEAELPAFFETLNRKVLESGIEVVRSKQGKEELIERFARVPVEYEVVGTYVQIKKFFASLVARKARPGQTPEPGGDPEVQERERIVSIENLALTNPVVRNREIHLTAKFTASTYRMEDRTEIAAPPPARGAKPAPKPAPPAAGSAAPAAGSAAKPPGAAGLERMKGGL